MNILLIEDMEDSRNLVVKLVMYLLRIFSIAPKTRQELREIASSKLKFDLVLLDGCLRHWGDVQNYRGVLEDIFKSLAWNGVIVGISTSQGILEEMEGVLNERANLEGRSSFHFIRGGKSLDTLSGALDEALRLLEQAKTEGGRMAKFKLIELHVGSMRCCSNCRPIGEKVIGLIAGPDSIQVKDKTQPARFYALGDPARDVIGEAAEFCPVNGWKEQDGVLSLQSREERLAWLHHDYDLLRENAMA